MSGFYRGGAVEFEYVSEFVSKIVDVTRADSSAAGLLDKGNHVA
jgi:hypothetical protein